MTAKNDTFSVSPSEKIQRNKSLGKIIPITSRFKEMIYMWPARSIVRSWNRVRAIIALMSVLGMIMTLFAVSNVIHSDISRILVGILWTALVFMIFNFFFGRKNAQLFRILLTTNLRKYDHAKKILNSHEDYRYNPLMECILYTFLGFILWQILRIPEIQNVIIF